jgi:hypothetical protein
MAKPPKRASGLEHYEVSSLYPAATRIVTDLQGYARRQGPMRVLFSVTCASAIACVMIVLGAHPLLTAGVYALNLTVLLAAGLRRRP